MQRDSKQNDVIIPHSADTIGIVRDFIFDRLHAAQIQLRELQQQRDLDVAAIELTAAEIRVARKWLRQLVSSESVVQTVKEQQLVK